MTHGTVNDYNPRRGTGFVRPAHGADLFPFSHRPAPTVPLQSGDPVQFTVVGGRIGIVARDVRRVRASV